MSSIEHDCYYNESMTIFRQTKEGNASVDFNSFVFLPFSPDNKEIDRSNFRQGSNEEKKKKNNINIMFIELQELTRIMHVTFFLLELS